MGFMDRFTDAGSSGGRVLAPGGRRALLGLLRGLHGGRLELIEDGRALAFGSAEAPLRARVEVRDPRAYSWTLRGSTGLGEGYVEGLWKVDDLVALARIACRNLDPFDRWRRRLQPVIGPLERALSLVPRNTRTGAARNISAHYDLGNRLFESFLDERLMYSCAYWPSDEATLSEAQEAKLERICERLDLGPDDHLLEIGTGWGGLAIHAASTRGCRVTTTTISAEQYAYASERVREAGLSDRVELLLSDYRDLAGTYDKLVSIEMIEAVGWQYFPAFFSKCAALTRPGGAMFLQAIVIRDDLYEQEKASRSFSNKHIFPGGCLPSLELIAGLANRNGMPVSWSEEISPHYVRTLAAWRERFNDAWPELRGLGYDGRFKRLWNFYLAFSEGGFAERRIRDVQVLLAKPGWERRRSAAAEAQAVSNSRSGRSSPGHVPVAR
ncbi:MAG TPA: cyclopropane-fatty-acyl-phospholipid synthase family protein [Solirubrobacterales bacterium]|nr:cyclopropane-fatty-acyl-phospholipid synthase family protein [Solirubrobacterales bacterium]